MIQWLHQLGEWFQNIFDIASVYIQHTIDGLVSLFSIFPKIFTLVSNVLLHIPQVFTSFILITIIILVVYLILNRDAGDAS